MADSSSTQKIIEGARTVAHLATHLRELKQASEVLMERFSASERGYFNPSEEDEVRHIHVSYLQTRSALFEVVLSFRDYRNLSVDVQPAAFLVAYSGALLLIDAARFLRESFEDRLVVRRKLNEAVPSFGIPAGTYDTVQKSLTDPEHVWQVYQAIQYFDDNERDLRQAAQSDLLAPVMDVIENLSERVKVGLRTYMKARVKVRARQLLKGINEEAIGQVMYIIQQYASRLVSGLSFHPGHQPALPDDIADEIRELLRPGDIFVTRKEYVLTNYFLPGYWPHAALYMGDESDLIAMGIQDHENVKPRWQRLLALDPDEPKRVFEALKDGAWIRSLKSPFSVDAVAVIRPHLSQEQVAEALARGLFHEGKSYDFDFDFTRSDRIVCTEVVYRTYEGIGDMKFKLTPRAGRMTLSAEDLLRMALKRENFEPVAVFAPSHKKGLISGERADELLDETMSED